MAKRKNSGRPYFAFEDVSKAFGSTVVLKDISFEVERGTTLCILGHMGAGKSVCLLLMGFFKPDSGRVIAAAEDITDYSDGQLDHIHRGIEMVFPNGALSNTLTIAENVAVPLREHGSLSQTRTEERAEMLLDALGIREARNYFPSEVSAEVQRWAAIARAFAGDSQAILLDEPTTMVSASMVRRLVDLIQRTKAELKMTSVVVTHNMQFARAIADRVLLLDQGKVLFSGTIAEMMGSSDPLVRLFLSNPRQCDPMSTGRLAFGDA